MNNLKHAINAAGFLLLIMVTLLNAGGSLATELNDIAWTESAKADLESVKKRLNILSSGDENSDELASIQKTVVPLRTQSQACVLETEKNLEKRLGDLESLGTQSSSETVDVRKAHAELNDQIKQLQNRLAACRYIALQVKDIKEAAIALERASLTRHLLFQGPGILAVIQASLAPLYR